MISINHNWGFFSCCSVKLHTVVDYFNKTRSLPVYVDGLRLFDWYKPEYKKEKDITDDYFENRVDKNIPFLSEINYKEDYQFSDYQKLDYEKISPFIDKYFQPSSEIRSIINRMEKKYDLLGKYDNICVLFYRGNDKMTETRLSSYEDFLMKARLVQKKNPSVLFLIQSDETEFIELMTKKFSNSFYFKDEIRHMNRCINTVDKVFKETNYEFSKKYLAITMIMAKCNTIICGSGNCSIWIMFYRKNAENLYQHLVDKWIDPKDKDTSSDNIILEEIIEKAENLDPKPVKKPPTNLGFIFTRHVNSEATNDYWIECYHCIRRFYPHHKILIIDDNSNYSFIDGKGIKLTNCEVINSAFIGRGEILPYYYFYETQMFDKAVVIQDSVYLQQYIDFDNLGSIKFLWDFTHDWDIIDGEKQMLGCLQNRSSLLELHDQKEKWLGCYGTMSVISYDFVESLVDKYDLFRLLEVIKCRGDRQILERVFAVICNGMNKVLVNDSSILGNMNRYHLRYMRPYEYSFDEYLQDKKTGKFENLGLPIIKVLTGR